METFENENEWDGDSTLPFNSSNFFSNALKAILYLKIQRRGNLMPYLNKNLKFQQFLKLYFR